MKDLTVTKATIKAKVLGTMGDGRGVALQVLIKEIEYEAINNCTNGCKNGKIILDDFSERGVFYVRNWVREQTFFSMASHFVRDDIIVFSIVNNGHDRYFFTSLRFDYNFCNSGCGLPSLIEKYT
jgi:hypothetical protein